MKWYSEVNKFWQKSHEKDKTPLNFILIGTKLDARNDAAYVAKLSSEGKEIVTTEKVFFLLFYFYYFIKIRVKKWLINYMLKRMSNVVQKKEQI